MSVIFAADDNGELRFVADAQGRGVKTSSDRHHIVDDVDRGELPQPPRRAVVEGDFEQSSKGSYHASKDGVTISESEPPESDEDE